MRHLFLADPSLWRVRWCFGAGSRPRSTATFPFEMYLLRINFALQKVIFDLVDVAFRAFQRGMWHGFVPDRISRYILKPLVARTGFLLRSRYISSTFVVRGWRSAPIEPREEGYADRTVPRVSRVPNEPCPDRTALGLPQSDRVPIEPRTKRAGWRSAPIEPRTDRGRGDSQGEPEPPLFFSSETLSKAFAQSYPLSPSIGKPVRACMVCRLPGTHSASPRRTSPRMVLGYYRGDMHAEGAGEADRLAPDSLFDLSNGREGYHG